MEREILVPLDGSRLAETALPHAITLARATGSRLLLLQAVAQPTLAETVPSLLPVGVVVPLPSVEMRQAEVAAAHGYLQELAATQPADVPIHTRVVEGTPEAVISAWAAEDPTQRMVVMTTHGRSGPARLLFGSVADGILHAAPAPLLLVRGDEHHLPTPPAHSYRRIVVPLDGSPLAEQALEMALPLAAHTGATILLVGIAPDMQVQPGMVAPPMRDDDGLALLTVYLDRLAARLSATHARVLTQILLGDPAAGICRAATDYEADLIVMATHARHGLERLWPGSVAQTVLREVARPVLLVHP